MKNIILKISLMAVLSALVVSCRDFLDRESSTTYFPEQVYSTPEGVQTAIDGMFASMASGEYYGSSWHGLINPMSGRFYSNQTASADATSLNCGTNNTWVTRLWPQMFSTIESANNIITNVQGRTNLSNHDIALGEAYFIRGVVYFDLVRLFGGVPLRDKPTTTENLYLPRATKSEVYAQIISDFNKAKQLMPNVGQYQADKPTKWAAYGYLAKVYMQLAGEDGGNPAYWQDAWNEAIQVYGKFSLLSNYSFLFDADHKNSTESIFELQYDHSGTIRNSDRPRMYTPSSSNYVGTAYTTFGWVRPNKEVFDRFKVQYPGDPRFEATFIYNNYQKYNNLGVLTTQKLYPAIKTGANGFAVIKKWIDPTYNGTTTNKNFIVFRYADLLLMLAEIENELHGPANAYQYVNQVLLRARTSVTPAATQPVNWSGMTQSQFRDRIMHEREFELLSEGQDWFDTRRRGYQYFIDHTITPHNTNANIQVGNSDYLYPTDKKNMLLPIPQTEIAANPKMSASDQNYGY